MSNPLLLPDVREMLAENDVAGLREFCEGLYPAVVADVFEGMPAREVWQVLATCAIERQAEIFEYIEPHLQMEMVEAVERERLSRLVAAMSADDRTRLLSAMDDDHVEALLPLIAQAEREEIKKLLSYPEDSAGSIMTTEYASIPADILIRDAIERLRQQAPDSETIYYVFVLDEERRLHGVITLRELILAKPAALVVDVMKRNVVAARVGDDLRDAAGQLALYDLIALPVVDEQNRLVGIITHDDVLDVVQESADEDAYKQSAMEPLERGYLSTPLLAMAWKRGIWLWFLSVVALGTAKVIEAFGGVSNQFVWMEWFLPLVLASGGNTGSQSATLVIRELGKGEMTLGEKQKIARREFATGLILGAVLGAFVWVSAAAFFQLSASEATVVGGTVFLVVIAGSVLGSQLPLLFDWMGMDPAYMSNPLIASLSDNLASCIYFTIAILILLRWSL